MKEITGTSNLVTGASTTAPPAPPFTYLGVAESLMPGIEVLAASEGQIAYAAALLTSHALECLLKAAPSKDGSDRQVKKENLRHNLEGLWHESRRCGLPVDAAPPTWVLTLSKLHASPYHLRYSVGVHGVVLPAVAPMVADLRELMRQVRVFVTT
jgi:hypothetical protein